MWSAYIEFICQVTRHRVIFVENIHVKQFVVFFLGLVFEKQSTLATAIKFYGKVVIFCLHFLSVLDYGNFHKIQQAEGYDSFLGAI